MPRMNVAISKTHIPCCRKFRFFMSTKVYPYLLIARFGKRQSPLEWGYNPMHTPPTDRVEKNTTADRGGDEHATHPRRSNPPTPHAWQKHKRNSPLHETITPRATSWFYSMIRSRVSTSRWNLQYWHEKPLKAVFRIHQNLVFDIFLMYKYTKKNVHRNKSSLPFPVGNLKHAFYRQMHRSTARPSVIESCRTQRLSSLSKNNDIQEQQAKSFRAQQSTEGLWKG